MENLFSKLLPKYISIIENEEVNSESYKWEAIEHFQKNWDLNVSDFHEMFKRSFAKRSNLMFQNSYGFLNQLSREMPEDARSLFRELFDESVSIEIRILNHRKKSDQLLVTLKEKLNKTTFTHQQDERTIAFLLTLNNPESYFLYKDNVYTNYCKFLGITPNKSGKKYSHFTQLGKESIELIKINGDLYKHPKVLELVHSYPFDSSNLLFQDILYRTLVLGSNTEKFTEFMSQIADDIKGKLDEINHPLARHKWIDNDSTNFRQVSVFENYDSYPIHYEIMLHSDIAWEFHAEGNLQQKTFMEPFIQSYDKSKYKTIPWKHGITKNYIPGTFHKISPKKRFNVEQKGLKYEEMIMNLTNQFTELYQDTNYKLAHYLNKNHSTASEVGIALVTMKKTALNQILYGPPGTGKTYSTIDQVVSICEPSEYRKDDHEANKRVYDRLVKEGQVVFTTFHQSMAYEDFVEGIKPSSTDTGKIAYDVANGIFKEMCDKAKGVAGSKHTESNFDFNNTTYWKMSLGGKNRPDVSNWCIENNFIALGWGGDNDCTPLQGITKWESFRDKFIELFPEKVDESAFNIQAMYAFQNWMKKGDVVVISKGNKIIEAVGVIEEEYQFIPEPPFPYHHTRKVRWLATNMNAAPSLFLDINISQQTIYRFNSDDVKTEEFKKNFGTNTVESNQTQSYVLVIDEINRGNVSAIFGELITLIEEDKRLGAGNELTVTLPYSKEKFGVPSNLHIIGTMNTADRSVEALDTALRRRFSFVEMLPDPKALRSKGTHGEGLIEDIDLADLLTIINNRIEVLVDRDHTIGHAFFINDKSINDLKHTFKNKIIPLLQEYFYGNYQKMALVLGNSFFSIKEQKSVKFAEDVKDYDFSDQVYTIRDCTDNNFDFLNAIRKLMNRPVKENSDEPKEVNQKPESEAIEQNNG